MSHRIRAALLSILLLAGLAGTAGVTAVRPAVGPGPDLPRLERTADGMLVAADTDAAVDLAVSTGQRVVVGGLTDPWTRHLANPDRTVTYEASEVAERVLRDKQWWPVDTTLRVQPLGGRLAPGATLLDMSFSAGGSGPLLILDAGPYRLTLTWPNPLPAPLLSGDTAVYPNVWPGVDLKVRAEPESFSQVLVVRTRAAASNPALSRIAWRFATTGLTLRLTPSGVLEAVSTVGAHVVFRSPASHMWDTPSGADPADPNHEPAPRSHVRLPVELTATDIAVRPDLAVLDDPATSYPVMIDPPFEKEPMKWALISRSHPNTSYDSGSDWPRDYVRVGKVYQESDVWRAHFMFNIHAMENQQLTANPKFFIKLDHSASCGPTPVQLWRTNNIAADSITWNAMVEERWLGLIQERSANANEGGGCGSIQPDVTMEFSSDNLRDELQGAMDNAYDTFTVGLRARSESDDFQWKRFARGTAKLTANYNLPPTAPTSLGLHVTTECYLSCGSPAVMRTRTPTLKATVSDPNQDKMTVQFEVRNDDKSTVVAGTDDITSVSDDATATWKTPTLPQESRLHFRVRAKDTYKWGPWSGYFTMVIDTQAPAVPTVSSVDYPHKDTGTWNGGIGQAGTFAFDPNGSTDVVTYQWRFNQGAISSYDVGAGSAHGVTRWLAPPGDLEQLLELRSVDRAGWTSAWQPYPFYVRPEPVDKAYWKFDEGVGSAATTGTGGPAYSGTLTGGATWATSGISPINPTASGSAVSLNGSTGYVEMPAVLDTAHAAGFTVSAWANLTTLTAYRTVLVQDGVNQAMFRLYYSPDRNNGAGAWCFSMRAGDSPEAALSAVCSPADQLRLNTWTFLVGVYDRPAGKLRLYVDGGPDNGEWPPGWVGETTAPVPWAATGSFQVGRGKTSADNQPTSYFAGRVDEVRAYQRPLLESEVRFLFLECMHATCPPQT